MGFLHTPELLILVVVALIFLGPKKLPEAGRGLGRAIRGFRDETQGIRDEISSIKDDTSGIRKEMTDIHDTVHTTVTDAVNPAKVPPTAAKDTVGADATKPEFADEPLPVGSNEELIRS